jgi:hypothetical protein
MTGVGKQKKMRRVMINWTKPEGDSLTEKHKITSRSCQKIWTSVDFIVLADMIRAVKAGEVLTCSTVSVYLDEQLMKADEP